jgi:hypothetical protein
MVDALLGYCVHVKKYISLDFLFSYTCNFASLLLQITNPRSKGTADTFGPLEFTLVLCGVCVAQLLAFFVVFCVSFFSLCHFVSHHVLESRHLITPFVSSNFSGTTF